MHPKIRPESSPETKNTKKFREGGNRALVMGFLADANFEAPKTLFLKAFQGLKNYLD